MRFVLIRFIRLYQLILSPYIGRACRFEPSCSNYAIEAIQIHGAFKGFYLAIHRIFRCNPCCRSGYDPVPKKDR